MGISSGFFDSLNGDRKYNVTQLSVLVSSLIKDGVFQNIGTAFSVTPNVGSEVLIGIGYGFFKHRWIQNDSLYPLNMGAAELLLNRIDAVVIEFDNTEAVRLGTIKKVKGTPSATPVRPALIKTDFINQYPLAYILRPANNDNIVAGNITQMIGTAECPFVIGVQETLDIDFLFDQWGGQWSTWFTALQNESETEMTSLLAEFNTWFNAMKGQLTTDAAGNLQTQINTINTNIGGWRTYNKISDISTSLHMESSTMLQIILAMADNSIFRTYIATATNPDLPANATGHLEITKTYLNSPVARRAVVRFVTTEGDEHVRITLAGDGSTIGPWKRFIDSTDFGLVYASITEMGLVAATCTLQNIVNAMMIGSEYWASIGSASIFPNITFPTTAGKLIVRKWSALSTEVEWHPADSSNKAYYFMMTKLADGILTGVWTQYATKTDLGAYATNAALGVQVAVQSTAPADTTKLWVW